MGIDGIDGGFPDFPSQAEFQLLGIIQIGKRKTHFFQMLLHRPHITDHNICRFRLPHFHGIMEKADFGPQFFKTAHSLKEVLAGGSLPFV